MNIDFSLYAIADFETIGNRPLIDAVKSAIEGGATIIQYRDKIRSTRELIESALQIKEITKEHNIPFIINDRVDVALAVDSDGVHLGQDDMPLEIARRILGDKKIIGISAKTVEQARKAQNKGATYLGVGAMFPTQTKVKTILRGPDTIKEMRQNGITLPIVAIGGINTDNIHYCINAGADGVAIVSAIFKADNIKEKTLELMTEIRKLK